MDFFELETSGGGTWRSGDVIDYATKLVLAGPVTATQTGADAVASLQAVIAEAERLLGGALVEISPTPPRARSRRSSSSPTTVPVSKARRSPA